jgi:choline dehydrogenase
MPAAFYINVYRPKFNWQHNSVEQDALHGRRIYLPAGRGLGGSSAIHDCFHLRGHRLDYDDWGRMGAEGWSFAAALPAFRRSEDCEAAVDPNYRGRGGPMRIHKARPVGAIAEAYLDAAGGLGLSYNSDPNGAEQEGAFTSDETIRDGERESTATAYLRDGVKGTGLVVRTGVQVRRILLEKDRAVGVEVEAQGRQVEVRADEIIVSAGAVRSPHLLMLSGIGPAAELARHGIPVVLDHPHVGQNLQDHLILQLGYMATKPVSHARYLRTDRKLLAGLRWLVMRDGICATTGFEVGTIMRSSLAVDRPDLQSYLCPILTNGFVPRTDQHGFSIGALVNRCRSRGTIGLLSGDPRVAPRIDPNYLSHPDDLAMLRDAFAFCRALASQRSFDGFRGLELGPGRGKDVEIEWLRSNVVSGWHLSGTCRMGRPDESVTDGQGRVHGIAGLRVVDASLMPHVPNANTNASTIMLAERISHLMLDHQDRPQTLKSAA